jgi:hypothetical protein
MLRNRFRVRSLHLCPQTYIAKQITEVFCVIILVRTSLRAVGVLMLASSQQWKNVVARSGG